MGIEELSAVVLCGGRGTRAYPHTLELPKPLLEVAGRPVLEHVLQIYAAQGVRRFVLAAGYKIEMIEDFCGCLPSDWEVHVVDTGADSGTGARLLACREQVGGRFFATYGDGVGDVDLGALLAFHESTSAAATITTVPLRSQYGTVEADASGLVRRFREKPVLSDHWVNGGFFVIEARAFEHWCGTDLEREVMPAMASAGELAAYRHHGFWKSLDTYKDALELTALAEGGAPPWLAGPGAGPAS